jgi:hypothetical protein
MSTFTQITIYIYIYVKRLSQKIDEPSFKQKWHLGKQSTSKLFLLCERRVLPRLATLFFPTLYDKNPNKGLHGKKVRQAKDIYNINIYNIYSFLNI